MVKSKGVLHDSMGLCGRLGVGGKCNDLSIFVCG